MKTAIVDSTEITNNRDAAIQTVLATVKTIDGSRTVEVTPAPGLEINPGKGEKLIIAAIGNGSYMVSVGGTSPVPPDTAEGERRLYSVDSGGDVAGFITLRNDGNIELNGAVDNAVAFSELKTAFNSLKQTLDDFITKFNSHIHITTATIGAGAVLGTISPTVVLATPSTANIDPAKVEKVKLP